MSNPKPKPKRRYKRYSSEFKREALLRASDELDSRKAKSTDSGQNSALRDPRPMTLRRLPHHTHKNSSDLSRKIRHHRLLDKLHSAVA
jgi:hypothetical protein